MSKICLMFGHPRKYCYREEEYCEKCARSLQEEEQHECRDIDCFHCKEDFITEDKERNEYKKN